MGKTITNGVYVELRGLKEGDYKMIFQAMQEHGAWTRPGAGGGGNGWWSGFFEQSDYDKLKHVFEAFK
jgi:hypothetical protein